MRTEDTPNKTIKAYLRKEEVTGSCGICGHETSPTNDMFKPPILTPSKNTWYVVVLPVMYVIACQKIAWLRAVIKEYLKTIST